MQPVLDDPAENLFFSKSSLLSAPYAKRANIAQNVRPFEDSPMLSRKTSGASTKTFLVPLWLIHCSFIRFTEKHSYLQASAG